MYQRLIDEVAGLANQHKHTLLQVYRRLFSDAMVTESEIADLQAVFPYAISEQGAVVALFGLDRRPCAHQLTLGGVRRYTWCIWDAFFIAETLGEDAAIHTQDPMSGETLHATWCDQRWQVNEAYWASFPHQQMDGGLRNTFCRFVHLFANEAQARAYQRDQACELVPMSLFLARSRRMAQAMQPSDLSQHDLMRFSRVG